jgi:hypothetical protein
MGIDLLKKFLPEVLCRIELLDRSEITQTSEALSKLLPSRERARSPSLSPPQVLQLRLVVHRGQPANHTPEGVPRSLHSSDFGVLKIECWLRHRAKLI